MGHFTDVDDSFRQGRSPIVLHDVQAGAAPIGAVAKAVLVDEDVGRVQDDGPVGARVDQLLRRRRHAGADLDGAELVADVVDPDAGVLVGGEDQRRALETARPVLVNVVRAEMSTDGDIVRDRLAAERSRYRSGSTSPDCRTPRSA